MLHARLRSGNTGAARGVVVFLQGGAGLIAEASGLRLVRADAGFFEEALLAFLEAWGLAYVVVARMTAQVKSRSRQIRDWREKDADYAVGEFRGRL